MIRDLEKSIWNVLAGILLLTCLGLSATAEVRITPSTPPAVAAGACFQFTASQAGTWSVACQGAGCQAGTIDGSGRYCAPAVVVAKNQSRGCQLGPNDNIYNTPVNRLPLHKYSSRWLERIASENDGGPSSWIYHHFAIPTPGLISLYDNVVDNSTPKQKRHFYYGGPWQDTEFSQPLPPDVEMESGWSQDMNAGFDGHLFSINRETCDDEELYQEYVDFKSFSFSKGNPTVVKFSTNTIRPIPNPLRVYITAPDDTCHISGTYMAKVVSHTELQVPFDSTHCNLRGAQIASSSVNCPTCNSASGAHWPAASNALLSGVDAAGSPLSRTSVHPQEWWNAVQKHILDPACNCVTLGHALRTTLTNTDIAPADLWPSISGHDVTGGHPQIRPISTSSANPVEFLISSNDCNGQSFLQCMKPCDNWTLSVGCRFAVVFGGGTGPWAALNGKHYTAIATGASSFKIPVDASRSGAMPGGLYFYFDWAPYGSRFRLKSSFDVARFCSEDSLASRCPYEKAILNTLQVYGMILLDGTAPADNWDSNTVSDEFFPDQLVDAMTDLNHSAALGYNPKWPAGGGFEQYLEIVDESGLQVSSDPNYLGVTNNGRVTVTVTTSGHGSASMDVNLMGTTVGIERGRMAVAAMPGNTYQIHAWVNGNANAALSYTMLPAISGASVSSAGLVKAPSSLAKVAKTTVNVCSAAAGATDQCAYVDLFFIPVSSDGAVRLWFGGRQISYMDRSRNTWWGQVVNRDFDTHYEIAEGVNFANLYGSWGSAANNWSGVPDAELYAQSAASHNDMLLNIAVPNGTYTLTLYGEPGYGTKGPGQNIFDLEVGGQVIASYQDGYVLAGAAFHGWTKQFQTTVKNGILEVGARIRQPSTYGISLSSLLITRSAADERR